MTRYHRPLRAGLALLMGLVLWIASALMPVSAASGIQPDYGYSYIIDPGGWAVVTGYTGYAELPIIPDTLGGFPVKRIGSWAFREQTSLTGVVIPEGVEVIDYEAFYGCTNLKSVFLPSTLTQIYDRAFAKTGLESITLPDSMQMLSYDAFNDTLIRSIHLPRLVSIFPTLLPPRMVPFQNCPNLASITVDEKNTSLTVKDGALVYSGYILRYPPAKTDPAFTIPDKVTNIVYGAFEGNPYLKTIIVPLTLQRMSSFGPAPGLAGFMVERHVPKFDPYSPCIDIAPVSPFFSSQGMLFLHKNNTLVVYPPGKPDAALWLSSKVRAIEQGAFDYAQLETLVLPSSITTLPRLGKAEKLRYIFVSPSVQTISSDAFTDCSPDLTIICYRNSPIYRFAAEKGLRYRLVEELVPMELSEDETIRRALQACRAPVPAKPDADTYRYTLDQDGQATITGFEGQKLITGDSATLELPAELDGHPVTAIGESAFYNCNDYLVVTIPDSVRTIGKEAFGFCSKLRWVDLGKDVQFIDHTAFRDSPIEVFAVNSDNPYFMNQTGGLYTKDGAVLVAYPSNEKKDVLFVPKTVKAIGPAAFYDAPLNTLVLPSGLLAIEEEAFYNATLKEIFIPKSVTTIAGFEQDEPENNALFGNCRATIYCYKDSAALAYAQQVGMPYVVVDEMAKGDIDLQSGITVTDARIALGAAVGKENLKPAFIARADVDNDGAVSVADARLILQAAVGKIQLAG